MTIASSSKKARPSLSICSPEQNRQPSIPCMVLTCLDSFPRKALTPPVADPTRAFYESLLEEKPDSAIAVRFCIGLRRMQKDSGELPWPALA